MEAKQEPGNRFQGFLAILYYEFLWNVRKKKTIGLFILVFAIVTLELALPPILAYYQGQPLQRSSTFVFTGVASLNGIFIFLLAVATTMNTISGEFESGSIVPLLTKPVSKTLVFVGKVLASFLTLLAAYAFLAIYTVVGGILIQGPQDNLQLVPLGVLGIALGTMVWAALVLALGTLSKSSVVSALGSFGFYIGLTIVGSLLASFLGQTAILYYTPGDGALASTGACSARGLEVNGKTPPFFTGTNDLGFVLMRWALNPDLAVNFCGFRFSRGMTEPTLLAADTVSGVTLRALEVTMVYVAGLLLLSWYAFRRTQITESA